MQTNLETKQKYWREQLPKFEAKYWLPDHFSFLNFDMEQGNYVVKEDLNPIYEDDATEIYHRVNTGWAMWKKCTSSMKAEIDPIFDIFHIGSDVRNIRTLQANIENSSRRSNCLSRIEGIITETLISDEPESYGEEYQESLLNWGESPDQYESRFKSIWDAKQAEIDELKAKLEKAQVPEGFVLVPKECPDPIFADKLFDLLCKKAHGEFGDDQMIFFSDIDECAIWNTMIEAAQGEEE